MREWEELPDEESIKRMNAEYRRISVLQGAAQGAESTGGKDAPREQSEQEATEQREQSEQGKAAQDAQTAGECLSALRAVRACAQTMREKSARASGALRLLSPLAESLLKEAEELCAQTGAEEENEAVPAAANYAACKRAMEEAAVRAFFALDGLAGRYPRAQRAQVRALALCFFCARL